MYQLACELDEATLIYSNNDNDNDTTWMTDDFNATILDSTEAEPTKTLLDLTPINAFTAVSIVSSVLQNAALMNSSDAPFIALSLEKN